MGSLIGIIFWVVFMAILVKRATTTGKKAQKKPQQTTRPVAQARPVETTTSSVADQLKKRREQLEAEQRRRQQQQQGDILARANANAKVFSEDTTQAEMEESHGHSDTEASTDTWAYLEEQREAHPHDAAHVAAELDAEEGMLLGTVEDLMVKGYEGKLPYERDFVGEGLDMIARFTLGGTSMGSDSQAVAAEAGE